MRSRFHTLGLGLLLAIGLSVPALGPAFAQSQPKDIEGQYPPCSKQPTDAQSDEAHKKYLVGKDAYDGSDWDAAIRSFNEAYRADCTKHELLVIISRAYEQKHELRESVETLKLYLRRAANVSQTDRDNYERRIKRLSDELAKASPQPTTSNTVAPPLTATAPPTASNSGPPPPPASHHSPYPFILAGVGAAAVIVGVVVILTTPALPANCDADSEICRVPTTPGIDEASYRANELASDQKKAGTHKSQPIVGGAIVAGGGLMLVGGILWFFLEPTTPDKAGALTPRISPQLAPGYGGFSLTGTF